MKTMKLVFAIIVIAALPVSNAVLAQPVQTDIVVTVTDYDYSVVSPEIGVVNGTYTYHFSYKLSKEGYLESIHWNARDFNLVNSNGEKVIVVDSGHDTQGVLWIWFNTPDYMNGYYPGIQYSTDENWLTPFYPEQMPAEGVAVEMSCKILCKGAMFKMPILAILQINANGVVTVNVIKP
ncbi:MAG: hypothetical protein A2X05_08445 [Bacteroidetes bacterium GWE2_41_25]|nr:MAG: hypothetical protein A2X03_06815 [Bacteroidetes bacterium GWA2_40_15]OFX91257.1 MAG: hypothetical protein A2X06_01460 [Bacteroidetes bacterium GWC2_40_22]OFX92952.1 MAG: hypothetical protein A2X05_08445 [Bacteroidetes bacterium GWE2_41_25]OFY57747.1 MAG: hypothetical protein A2X04_17690 [Bacteroidetes bacterium GWF2_41_9]HAM08918.1 hypothetical protein [Bacteroidales bacterium]